MVLIEQELDKISEDAASHILLNSPESKNSKEDETYKDTSDGFEIASDGENNDEEEDDPLTRKNVELRHDQVPREKENEEQKHEQNPVSKDSYEDASNDEELKAKAMDQANDAKLKGNKLFVEGRYDDALIAYDTALHIAPEGDLSADIRSICHSNRAACFSKLGKYEDSIKQCTKALELKPTYLKALTRRAEAHEKQEHFDEAIADLKKIMELEPSNDNARRTIRRLDPLAEEKREKMKEEMIGKLKDMGNSILGRFGMSVDNFKSVKDPNTGSYSISFQR